MSDQRLALPLSRLPDQELRIVEVDVDCANCDGLGWVGELVQESDGEHIEHFPCRICGGSGIKEGEKAP